MKTSGLIDAIKEIATDRDGLNIACFRGLLELLNKDRLDIIKSIKKLKNSYPEKYTPELIAEQIKDTSKIIAKYDAMYNEHTIKAEYAEQEYIQKKIAYDLGESEENPDEN